MFVLEHVTGNYFLGWAYEAYGGRSPISVGRVEFQMGVDGKAESIGIEYELSLERDLIWFDRSSSASRL